MTDFGSFGLVRSANFGLYSFSYSSRWTSLARLSLPAVGLGEVPDLLGGRDAADDVDERPADELVVARLLRRLQLGRLPGLGQLLVDELGLGRDRLGSARDRRARASTTAAARASRQVRVNSGVMVPFS